MMLIPPCRNNQRKTTKTEKYRKASIFFYQFKFVSPVVTIFCILCIQGLTKNMTTKYRMEGCVDGHKFVITGDGIGDPFE